MPSASGVFLRAAKQRLHTAEFLLKNAYNLDAMYLAGYTIECALKALILERTPRRDKKSTLNAITSGSVMHSPEKLAEVLKELGPPIPSGLILRVRKSRWSTNLRYDARRKDFERSSGVSQDGQGRA
jgi:hypothetical protein